ncbi:MAG: PAS domain-containing protein [Cyanobacteria bacterium REEB67]|nr:PAS domain-containing protein [Cyanobacteria bacterium REEB67]
MFFSILTAFGLVAFFNRSTADRLNVIMENTSRIAAGKPPLNFLGGDDELTRIDRLYRQMYQDLITLREKERAMLDNAAELICSIDTNLRISDINLSAEKILSTNPQELVGRRVLDLIDASSKDKASKKLEQAFDKLSEETPSTETVAFRLSVTYTVAATGFLWNSGDSAALKFGYQYRVIEPE